MSTTVYGVSQTSNNTVYAYGNDRFAAHYVLYCKCRQCGKVFVDYCRQGTPNLYSECNLIDYYRNCGVKQHECKSGRIGFGDIIGYDTIVNYNKRK